MDIIISVLFSGVVAALISFIGNAYQQKKQLKLRLITDLFGYKFQLVVGCTGEKNELKHAMNRIPIVFRCESQVVEAYKNVVNSLKSSNQTDPQQLNDLYISMLKRICDNVKIDYTKWNDSLIIDPFTI